MAYLKKHFICLAIIGGLLLPALTCLASDITQQMQTPLTGVNLPSSGNDETKILTMVGSAIGIFLSILGVIFLILIVYAGFKWMMAMGKEEEITAAKTILRAAIIGLIIVLAAYSIAFFITSRLEAALK